MTTQRIDLGYRPRAWQSTVHSNLKRFNVIAVHRRGGKSEVAIMELVHRALTTRLDLWLGVYVSPYLKQTRAIAWARLKQKVSPLVQHGVVEINESEMSVHFPRNGATIRLFGADLPHALRGLRLDFAVIDEVAQVKPEVWTDILQPALSDRKGACVFIGTPYGVNLFSNLYYKALAGNDPDWYAALFTCYDTQALDEVEVERLRRDMPEPVFARELLCDFSAAGDDQLLSLTDAETAARRVYAPGSNDYAPRIIGVDPARFGDDRSVVFKRQGLQAFDPLVYRGVDNMELAGRVASVIDQWSPDAVFIDAGAGAGVIDRLRQLGHSVVEVNFGGKSLQARYSNKRAEMWHEMADWIRAGGAIPNDPILKLELATPTYRYDAANRIVLESKDEIRKRLPDAGSPDLADALALTFAQPVASKPLYPVPPNPKGRDWDPYSLMR